MQGSDWAWMPRSRARSSSCTPPRGARRRPPLHGTDDRAAGERRNRVVHVLTGSAWPAPPGAISAVVQSGVTAISDLVDTARTEESLLRAQSELRFFAKLVKFELCAYGVLTDLQRRFVAVTSKLVLDDGIPVTFESNLLADWSIAAGSDLDKALERRVYEHTMASIAARDPRDAPSWIVRERLSATSCVIPRPRQRRLSVSSLTITSCPTARMSDNALKESSRGSPPQVAACARTRQPDRRPPEPRWLRRTRR